MEEAQQLALSMFKAEIDTSKLNKLLSQLSVETRKDLNAVIQDQAKIVLGKLIAMTPPGKRKGSEFLTKEGYIAKAAEQNARKVITADVAKLFPTAAQKEEKLLGLIAKGHLFNTAIGERKIKRTALTLAEVKSVHKQARNSKGRVNAGRAAANMAITRKSIKREFLREQFKKIGWLNAGWMRAAQKLKLTKRATPAWISRHATSNPNGGITFKNNKKGLSISVFNRTPYYPSDAAQRIQQAIRRTERSIEGTIRAVVQKRIDRINKKAQSR